ncbi:hypothetical protein Naga_100214g3 [Nannochloropsis gaditana]|uniref:Uncharacterized protein n=1 Tax=Nannochloropsis gaditana TaxID=72520 RepID=W7TKN9_9STRA|nr:hypothetical protein Naga_100214g3 [Nannochloropsis gaditana]
MYQRYETRTGLVLLFLLRELNISCEGDLTRHSLEISPCQAARLGHDGMNFDFFLLAATESNHVQPNAFLHVFRGLGAWCSGLSHFPRDSKDMQGAFSLDPHCTRHQGHIYSCG